MRRYVGMRRWLPVVLLLVSACGTTLQIDHGGAAGVPSPRTGAAAAYDEATGTIVMFGGSDAAGVLGDTWTWDGQTWRLRHPAKSPPAREFGLMAFDPAKQRIVLFGGAACAPPGPNDPLGCGSQNQATVLADTWTWDGSTWSQLSPRHSPVVTDTRGLEGGAAADLHNGRLILVSRGSPTPTDFHIETWALDGGDWVRLYPKHSPLAYLFSNPAYDAVSGALILQQSAPPHIDYGPGAVPPPALHHSVTWSWDGSDWHDLGSVDATTPREYGTLISDGTKGAVLVSGLGAYYRWTGTSWTAGQLLPTTTFGQAPGRVDWAAAFEAPMRDIVLFGGRTWSTNHLYGDTIGFDGGSWTTLVQQPVSTPSPLAGCSATLAFHGETYFQGPGAADMQMWFDFGAPLAGPCYLDVKVVFKVVDRSGALMPMLGNPSTVPLSGALTWDAGVDRAVFTIAGACGLPAGWGWTVSAGDFQRRETATSLGPCTSQTSPPASLSGAATHAAI